MLPVWADVLVLAAIPAILLAAQHALDRLWGPEEPGNMTVHQQEDEEPPAVSDEDVLASR